MKILHPTDFSATAEKARILALDLAQRLDARLDVAFAQERSEARQDTYTHTPDDYVNPEMVKRHEENREIERKHYLERLRALTPQGGMEHLLWGRPVKRLLELSETYDLVVMGAHGANRLDNYFLGGVAGRVVRRSQVPVLTVRDEAETTQVKRLLVATDFGEASKHAWRWCQALAQAGVKLVPVHVIDVARLQNDTGYTQVVTEAMHNLDRGHSAERHVIREGDPVKDLPKIAQELAADAIVIGLQRHPAMLGLLLGSTADALLRSSPVPILSVPVSD